jgi:hypothetical protein
MVKKVVRSDFAHASDLLSYSAATATFRRRSGKLVLIAHGARVELVSAAGPRLGYRDVIIQALRDDDGEINGVVYIGIDVTAQVLEANTLPK